MIGEALIDLIQQGGDGSYDARPGGSPFNVAIGLGRLDVPVSLVARFGRDRLGMLLRRHAEASAVQLPPGTESPLPTTLALAAVDDAGQAGYSFYLDATAGLEWGDDGLGAGLAVGDLLHVGSIASWYGRSGEAVLALQRTVHAAGSTLISYDPNLRPSLIGDRDAAAGHVEAAVRAAHVVKASTEDLAWLYPNAAIADTAARWSAAGPGLVVVTAGGDGARAYADGAEVAATPVLRVEVRDTVGAGDAFMAGLLAGLVDAGVRAPAKLATLGPDGVAQALRFAATVAGRTCERPGADPPGRAELEPAAS